MLINTFPFSTGWSSGWPSSSSSGWNAWPSKVSYGWPSKVSTGWPSSGWSSGGWPSSGWSSGGWNNGKEEQFHALVLFIIQRIIRSEVHANDFLICLFHRMAKQLSWMVVNVYNTHQFHSIPAHLL